MTVVQTINNTELLLLTVANSGNSIVSTDTLSLVDIDV